MTKTLEQRLGLHQEITIYYVVTGYRAAFSTDDFQTELAAVEGETVIEALEGLRARLDELDST